MAELHIERVFDAPRELVWKAFTDPDEISQWFGPVGYSVPRETVDMDVILEGEMRELFGSERLSLRIELHDEDGKTRLVLHQGPFSEVMLGNAREGWISSFTKLDALLVGKATPRPTGTDQGSCGAGRHGAPRFRGGAECC